MKCLLLYASFGDGHVQVSNAIRHVLENDFVTEVVSVDTFRNTSPRMARFNEWIYEATTKFAPFLYGWSYDWTRRLSIRHPLWKVLSLFSRKAAWQAMRDHQPDIVIQLFPDHALARWPQLAKRPYLAVVLTDFAAHSRWFHDSVDLYLLPSTRVSEDAANLMPSHAKQQVSGIPIRSQFSSCMTAWQYVRPTIVVSAGGRGLFPDIDTVLHTLLHECSSYNVIVMCGRNERMLNVVRDLALSWNEQMRLQAIGYTEDISTWIQQASFVVAKAGGISIAECLACGTPMVFYRPQPGQELKNAKCIQDIGAGRIARNVRSLAKTLGEVTKESLGDMHNACIRHAQPFAAHAVVNTIVTEWRKTTT